MYVWRVSGKKHKKKKEAESVCTACPFLRGKAVLNHKLGLLRDTVWNSTRHFVWRHLCKHICPLQCQFRSSSLSAADLHSSFPGKWHGHQKCASQLCPVNPEATLPRAPTDSAPRAEVPMPKQWTFPWFSLQQGWQFPCCAKQKQSGRAFGNKAGPQGWWTRGIYFQFAGRRRGCPWWTASGERPGVGHQWAWPSVQQSRERSPADTGLSPPLWPWVLDFAKAKKRIFTIYCKAGAKIHECVVWGGKEMCQAQMGLYTSKSNLVSLWVQAWIWAWTTSQWCLCNLLTQGAL